MSIKTPLKDLSKSFQKFKAQEAAEKRKSAAIEELRQYYLRKQFSAAQAHNMAIAKYNSIHNNNGTK